MVQNLDYQIEDFQTLIEQSPTSIIIMDINWNIIYVNPKFVQLTGFTEEEAIGKNPRFQNSGDIGPEEYNEITGTVLSGKVWRGEFINKKKNGELYIEFAVISPIINSKGKITRIISLKEDITELRNTEKAFHDAEKFAALGKMASYITHEIKTPLTSIKTNIEMLLRRNGLPEYAYKSLGIVESEITRLSGLLSNIRESTRQEKFEFTEIYLPDLFNSIYEIISPQLELKKINFINNVSCCKVVGDVSKLKSLFMLLIENSISAINKEGEIEIYNTTMNCNCSVFLKDNGCGIETTDDIFKPFFTTKIDGTGLGLSIAQNIIEKHQGELKLVTSKPGETIFEVILKTGHGVE